MLQFWSLFIIIILTGFVMLPLGLKTLAAPILWCWGCCVFILLSGNGCVCADPGCYWDVELGGTWRAGRPAAFIPPFIKPLCCCFYELYESLDLPTNVGPLAKSFLGILCSLAFSFDWGCDAWFLFIGSKFFKLYSDWLLP